MSRFFSKYSKTNMDKEAIFLILERIERWCKENNTSIHALEQKCGIGNATISKWDESIPRIDTLRKVSVETGIPVNELIECCKQ
jgi:transcriptional regulator with XRE-family HTH domain|nr:MAG TPA: helix-turn-helix domain protein [Bacteriophage sp.]